MEHTGVTAAIQRARRETPSTATKLLGSCGMSHRSIWKFMCTSHVRRGRLIAVLLGVLALLTTLAAPAVAEPDGAQWDPTLPKIVSSGAPGDPVAIANASLQVSQLATQTTMELGRKFLSSLGLSGNDASVPSSVAPGSINRVNGRQAIEYVIRRGASQTGVPYSWGGGKPGGPSLGVDSGANTVGYDCSGFTQFAFAGVGVLIRKFSGDQYNTGRKIPPSQAKRGDLIFYGPGGTQHVAIYLGNGQVLESASSYGQVGVHPLRTAGLSPYLARIIES
jgi:cell wall-associated NlpC family hydrolase